MTKKVPADGLIGGVPETMLVPLYARAVETQREGGMVNDPLAVEMVSHIDYDFSRFANSRGSNLGVAVRTEILDELASAFIAAHPDAVVVNIAAGLDTRFDRVDNGHILWIDLDLPESIAMRRRFIQPAERQQFMAQSVLDFTWMDAIEKRDATLFIIEGLLMYFAEDDVRALLTTLAERFPGAEALIEVMGVSQARDTRSDAVDKTKVKFQWGIRHAPDIGDWHEAITYLTDISVLDRHADRWVEIDVEWGRASHLPWPERLQALRNTTDRIVHLRFG